MNLILLKNYNNYFNRIIKYHDKIDSYLENREYYDIGKINFRVNDGVETSHVVTMPLDMDFVPDYALLVEPMDGSYVILSRWFIMEWKKIAGSQYQALFHRDVIADHLKAIVKAPAFVEKGYIADPHSPLLYNNEDMTYNEIKSNEVLLKDRLEMAWLVGYFVQKLPGEETSKTFETTYTPRGSTEGTPIEEINPKIVINFGDDSIPTVTNQCIKRLSTFYDNNVNPKNVELSFQIDKDDGILVGINNYFNKNDFDAMPIWETLFDKHGKLSEFLTIYLQWARQYKGFIVDLLLNHIIDNTQDIDVDEINSINGKLVTKDGKNYYLQATPIENVVVEKKIPKSDKATISIFESLVTKNSNLLEWYNPNLVKAEERTFMKVRSENVAFIVKAIPSQVYEKRLSVTFTNKRNHLNDAPYDMFCIPYPKKLLTIIGAANDPVILPVPSLCLAMAKGLATQGGGLGSNNTYIYDVQLLPYCPIEELKAPNVSAINEQGEIRMVISQSNGFMNNVDYDVIYSGEEGNKKAVGICFWARKRSGTFYIEYNKPMPTDPIDIKVANETEQMRLCSPNYCGVFEFSPVKNKGFKYFNVDYTYKPFSPYIHINPVFDGLYGKDYDDQRGLIVGGDFSLETLTDAFVRYELNNKNYQKMFDREIENMEVNNKLNLSSQVAQAVIGVGTAAIGGGVAGGMVGHGVGGAILGGVGSAIGAAADIGISQAAYRENRDLKTDMFGYKLGNIKALPRSLAKTTAFTYNNKIFPFIEEYDCTEREKQALRDKLKYNGMTIMVVDKIGNYYNGNVSDENKKYFKCQMIRLDTISEDNHILQVIYDELNKGVYF